MAKNLDAFEDILASRRNEFSNFMWVSRKLNTVAPYKHTIKTTPEQHKLHVLKSTKMQEIINKLSESGNIPRNELEEQVKYILDEIGYDKKLKVIRWLGLILAKICSKVCAGIHVNKDCLFDLKSQMGQVPVMYVPSHRSYADFILMSYLCFHYDIEIPAIAAGMDFHGMMGMGNVLRSTGAFFMRRSYNNDALYWEIFRQYVNELVVNGDAGIEFFIEGTRSRSGKSLPPKFGLLSMILRAFFNGEVPDILFVPINISYDRFLEEKLFAFELLGVPKPKESTSAFFKSLRLIKENYGDVYVNFGTPISAHAFFGDAINRAANGVKPMHCRPLMETERKMTSLLAQEIVYTQQKLCVITTFNLIAVVLINNLVNNDPRLTLKKLMDDVVWIKSVIEMFGALTNFNNRSRTIFAALHVHKNLIEINEGQLHLIENDVILNNIKPNALKGHLLGEKTMTKAVPFVMLQLYVNPTMHYFIVPCILTVILKNAGGIDKDKLFELYCFLRAIFVDEFVLIANKDKLEFSISLKHLEQLNVIRMENNKVCLSTNEKLQKLLYNLFAPYIFAYYVVCNVLANITGIECSENAILVSCQRQLEEILNDENVNIHPYILNLNLIINCLNCLTTLKAIVKMKKNGSVIYQVCKESVLGIHSKLRSYIQNLPSEIFNKNIIKSGVQLDSKL